MTTPLIDRLTDDLGWPRHESDDTLAAWLARPGAHCLFVPGDPAKNPETADVAVILPEIAAAFAGRFDVAVVGDPIERAVRERFDCWPAPSLIFVAGGDCLGSIPKVRDWDDYLTRVAAILHGAPAAAA